MLPYTVSQKDSITKNIVMQAHGSLTLETNANRVTPITSVTNPLIAGTDIEDNPLMPIASVVEGHRPRRAGIVKGAASGNGYPTVGKTFGVINNSDTDAWSYSISQEDPYKYWQSEKISGANVSGTYGSGNYDLDDAQIHIVYSSPVRAHKIKILLENTYVDVTHATLQLIGGSDPVTLALSPADKDSEGNFVIWYIGGSWFNNYDPDTDTLDLIDFDEIKFTALTVDAPNARASVIEVAPYYVADLTDRITSINNDDTMSEHSQLLPMGTTNSNVADVVLENTDGAH